MASNHHTVHGIPLCLAPSLPTLGQGQPWMKHLINGPFDFISEAHLKTSDSGIVSTALKFHNPF